MEGFSSMGTNDMAGGKASRGGGSWTQIEEDLLIQCLKYIMKMGWKAENGFKCGFQRELEKGMHKLLVGTDIAANPHINSKIHVWKKEYVTLYDMLSKSGIGWNDTTNTLDVQYEGVWNDIKRAYPKVSAIRYNVWPYYGAW
ncbi:hypothetical protein ACS0TY_002609 [Phlomoides rotata]